MVRHYNVQIFMANIVQYSVDLVQSGTDTPTLSWDFLLFVLKYGCIVDDLLRRG